MPHILQNEYFERNWDGARGNSVWAVLWPTKYFEVAFGGGTGPVENESEYNFMQAHSYTDSHWGSRREPGERDAGRAQSRAAAAEAWPRAQSESARRKLPSRTVPYIRHFNLFSRHMLRARARAKERKRRN